MTMSAVKSSGHSWNVTHIVAALLAACFLFLAVGCNTVEGAGKDIERGGEKLQDAAN